MPPAPELLAIAVEVSSDPLRTVVLWFLVVALLGVSVLLAVAHHHRSHQDDDD